VSIAANVAEVAGRIRAAEARAGRPAGSVTLCAVSKTFPATAVREAVQAGITNIGENRVQEAVSKRVEAAVEGVRWHLIGHLQTNKVRPAVETFDVIQTIDSVRLAERVHRVAVALERSVEVLVQVELGHEPTKTGVDEADLQELVRAVDCLERLRLTGLMVIPPYDEQPENTRHWFRRLRELRDRLNEVRQTPLNELSMGMSHDFEVAIEEGATMVRVGTAVFGARG
jgi:hypothetical protein